jgi:hypothetical protein
MRKALGVSGRRLRRPLDQVTKRVHQRFYRGESLGRDQFWRYASADGGLEPDKQVDHVDGIHGGNQLLLR